MGDEELRKVIDGCLRNDRISQKLLYKAYYGLSMGICLRYATNRYEAAEIMNQGFFKAFKNLDRYDKGKPFKAWLGRILINTCIDYYRSNLKVNNTDDLDRAEHLSDNDRADKNLDYKELIALVQQLNPACRTVFNLYAIEGYTHEEIGTMLNISTGTSKSNLHKAREKLKQMLTNADTKPYKPGEHQTISMVLTKNDDLKNIFCEQQKQVDETRN